MARRRPRDDESEYYFGLSPWLSDLSRVVEVIEKYREPDERLRIQDHDYVFDSLEDVREVRGDSVTWLDIAVVNDESIIPRINVIGNALTTEVCVRGENREPIFRELDRLVSSWPNDGMAWRLVEKPDPPEAEPSFWERNRDKLAVQVIVLIFGTALGIAGTLIAQALSGR